MLNVKPVDDAVAIRVEVLNRHVVKPKARFVLAEPESAIGVVDDNVCRHGGFPMLMFAEGIRGLSAPAVR